MGRSKFPGKPSKLVTKKRVSVLNNPFSCTAFNENNDELDSEDRNNDLDNNLNDKSPTTNASPTSNSSIASVAITTTTLTSTSVTTTTIEALHTTKNAKNNTYANDAQTSGTDNQNLLNASNSNETSTSQQNKSQSNKKKKVSFKFTLETSDDLDITKKEPQPCTEPPVSIIKKECLTRAIRIARGGEPILMPSRLSGLTQKFRYNNAYNIDKLNSLTFKSQCKSKEKPTSFQRDDNTGGKPGSDDEQNNNECDESDSDSEDARRRRVNFGSDNEEENDSDEDENEEGGDSRIRDKKVKKDSNHDIENDDNRDARNDIKNSECDSNHDNSDGEGNSEAKAKGKDDDSENPLDKEEIKSRKKSVTGKYSVLPNQNTHSSRVNKPSKSQSTKKNNAFNLSKLNKSKNSKTETNVESSKSTIESNNVTDTKFCDKIENNPFIKINDNTSLKLSSSLSPILRQPRLQFANGMNSTQEQSKDRLLLSAYPISINRNPLQSSHAVCGICGTKAPSTVLHQSKKFGVISCNNCRKFISKSIKKLTSSIENTSLKLLQCRKNSGTCTILPIIRQSLKLALKERCPACWLKKCITSYRLAPELRSRLLSILPTVMKAEIDKISQTINLPSKSDNADKQTTPNQPTTNTTNLFANSLSNSLQLSAWSKRGLNSEFRVFGSLSRTNPLLENAVTFGSLPQPKPVINTNSIIMSKESDKLASESSTVDAKDLKNTKESKSSKDTIDIRDPKDSRDSKELRSSKETKDGKDEAKSTKTLEITELRKKRLSSHDEEPARPKLRRKDSIDTVPAAQTSTSDGSKRQRIDLKGPRVKHVCRSASIVLGQPIATFSRESPSLDDNAVVSAKLIDSVPSPKLTKIDEETEEDHQVDTENIEPSSEVVSNNLLSELTTNENVKETEKKVSEEKPVCKTKVPVPNIVSENGKNNTDTSKLMTRKVARPLSLINSINTNNKKLNSFINRQEKMTVKMPPTISLDFWENYDPTEVSQSGFGIILSEPIPLKALCFLCGSCGLEPLIFCVCCCEPYHQYCVEDEYNFRHSVVDDISILDTTVNSTASVNHRLNWLCPRCTICHSCNMASGSKVKCQKCLKNYHSTCLGTSKRLLGADRPLICANCLKCKSCGTTAVSKFVGNLPMCSPCFKLRQKGNFCPLCQKCYEQNDFNVKMMECGDCRQWVHYKCEGLTDEQYNMLSVLPENIEFICRQCATNNCAAETWKEAVAAEFNRGLLNVVKLLSKSRPACVLLKLSPRKNGKNMSHSRNLEPFSLNSRFGDVNADENKSDNLSPYDDNFSTQRNHGEDEDESDIIENENFSRDLCYFNNINQEQKSNNSKSQTLLDIKKKILTNKYYSLADFNYDMNSVINSASCEELVTTYKEILSETFPWFQNETKACTDALEEDMYNSCSFAQGSPGEDDIDQQVPTNNIPDDIDELFYEEIKSEDNRVCMFCKNIGDGPDSKESRLIYCGQNLWVHINCAMWSAEVFEEMDGTLQNVQSAISRGRLIKCSKCGHKGATVGCNVRTCGEHYHFPCARSANCTFFLDKSVYCELHAKNMIQENSDIIQTNFDVLRPVYVEPDRRKKKTANIKRVQFHLGSLHVKHLGRFVSKLSDLPDAIVPVDFACSRLYWSSKEPWKIVEYTVRTSIQSNINKISDLGKNYIIDHTANVNLVQRGLAQIAKWHASLLSGDDNEHSIKQERLFKQSAGSVVGQNEETNEEEPQTNADLLPPEIKDAIFEDLPHEILDGISMIDIFPKWMTYEEMVAIDMKNESNTDSLTKDNKDSKDGLPDDDLSKNSHTDFDTEHWSHSNIHVEDALLSGRTTSTPNGKELKRNKLDLFGNRSYQKSSNLPWTNKMDTNLTAKRLKMSRLDLRFPESVLFSLGRRKEETTNSINEISRHNSQADEIRNKTFTWSAAKRFAQLNETSQQQTVHLESSSVSKDFLDRLKITQLDGMDDVTSESESISVNEISQSSDLPVKCNRCYRTYRNQDSYARHLATCEPLSTSESESDTTPTSPEIQTTRMILTSVNNHFQGNQNQQINSTNQMSLQAQSTIANQIRPISIDNKCGKPVQVPGIFINPTSTIQQQHQTHQVFATQPITIGSLQQSIFPIQNITATAPARTLNIQQPTSQNIQCASQIISYTTANTSQVMTVTPSHQQNVSVANFTALKTIQSESSFNKNQIIVSQAEKSTTKKQRIGKVQASPSRPKNRNITPNALKQEFTKPTTFNSTDNLTNIRPLDNNVVIQPTTSTQPLIVQQMATANQENLVQYIAGPDGNPLQYFTIPTATNDYKPQQSQYLTTPIIPGAFQLQTDNNNLLLANTSNGFQVIPNGAFQLAPSQQPQVIGTIIQPQATTIQCGMISSEQMVLGGAPTFEMMSNPNPGCVLLTSQPVYYGLETIVQNTVMQSQQFVSTAMQGILSQNSSFSATTTQVFQASKIEPIMEMQPSYVVLNNDSTIMQQQAQTPILSANVLQQALPQIQAQQPQISTPQTSSWRLIDDNSLFSQNQTPTIIQPAQTTQAHILKPNVKPLQTQGQATWVSVQKPSTIQLAKPIIKSSPILVTEDQNQKKILMSNISPAKTTIATIANDSIAQQPIVNSTSGQKAAISQNKLKGITKRPKLPEKITTQKKNIIAKVATKAKGQPAAIRSKPVVSIPDNTLHNSDQKLLNNNTTPLPLYSTMPNDELKTVPQASIVLSPTKNQTNGFNSTNSLHSQKINQNISLSVYSTDNISTEQTSSSDHLLRINNKSKSDLLQKSSTSQLPQNSISLQNTQSIESQKSQLQNSITTHFNTNSANHNISLHQSSNSIHLPIAPYIPSYSNGIPTNVVTPIQQSNSSNSRPTNRVLPMQTQHKNLSPNTAAATNKTIEPKKKLQPAPIRKKLSLTPEPKEPESILSSEILQEENGIRNSNDKIKEFEKTEPVDSTTTDDGIKIYNEDIDDDEDDDDDDEKADTKTNMFGELKNAFMQLSSDEMFDKLKNQSDPRDNIEMEVENESIEVKAKISKILDNLENEKMLPKKDLDSIGSCDIRQNISSEAEHKTSSLNDTITDQKENLNPSVKLMNYTASPLKSQKPKKDTSTETPTGPRLLYEIQSQDGFTYKSTSITEIWEKVFESVQVARKAHGLSSLPVGPLADMCGYQMMGLKTNALKYLLEQLPGVETCSNYKPIYHQRSGKASSQASSSGYYSDYEDLKENSSGTARCEQYESRSDYDMFSWLASSHRKQPIQCHLPPNIENEIIPRRGSGSNLPMAMRYRTLKETYKDTVGVYRSHIHGRGLFCNRDIEAGEMVIEYAGELIRSSLTDKRERYYDSRGIGCYMFKIDDNLVVDATMRGNAARFINHSCEPNCYSKVVDILGHKHIIIFALRRIVQGEELTYDYKFPFEETKIPCTCDSRKCRKYLN